MREQYQRLEKLEARMKGCDYRFRKQFGVKTERTGLYIVNTYKIGGSSEDRVHDPVPIKVLGPKKSSPVTGQRKDLCGCEFREATLRDGRKTIIVL